MTVEEMEAWLSLMGFKRDTGKAPHHRSWDWWHDDRRRITVSTFIYLPAHEGIQDIKTWKFDYTSTVINPKGAIVTCSNPEHMHQLIVRTQELIDTFLASRAKELP